MNKNYQYMIIGFIVGLLFFILFENSKPSNSFNSECWIRQQPSWLVHNKCYIIGSLLIYREINGCNDPYIIALGGAWIGLHLAQDIAERYYLSNTNNLRETG